MHFLLLLLVYLHTLFLYLHLDLLEFLLQYCLLLLVFRTSICSVPIYSEPIFFASNDAFSNAFFVLGVNPNIFFAFSFPWTYKFFYRDSSLDRKRPYVPHLIGSAAPYATKQTQRISVSGSAPESARRCHRRPAHHSRWPHMPTHTKPVARTPPSSVHWPMKPAQCP